jgi:hypothetical protein
MTLRSKVAAGLAIVFLILPMGAAASCLLHRPAIRIKSSHCLMITHTGIWSDLHLARPSAPCCELTSGQSLPASTGQPITEISVALRAVSTANTGSHSIPANYETLDVPARAGGRTMQALLCVLLI